MKKCSTFMEHLETTGSNSAETRNIPLAAMPLIFAVCSTVNQPQSNRAGRIRSLEIGEDSMAQDANL